MNCLILIENLNAFIFPLPQESTYVNLETFQTMTKLFSIVVLHKGETAATILKVDEGSIKINLNIHLDFLQAGWDLSSISFFQRGTAQDFITFTSRILVERTGVGARQSVKEAEYMCHVFVRADKLAVVCVSDHEYPPRVAHTMMQRLSEDFAGRNNSWHVSLVFKADTDAELQARSLPRSGARARRYRVSLASARST